MWLWPHAHLGAADTSAGSDGTLQALQQRFSPQKNVYLSNIFSQSPLVGAHEPLSVLLANPIPSLDKDGSFRYTNKGNFCKNYSWERTRMCVRIQWRSLFCVLFLMLICCTTATAAQVTVLLPDQPSREEDPADKVREMDVLLALIDPFTHVAMPMDMPQRIAVIRALTPPPPPVQGDKPADANAPDAPTPPPFVQESEELLGDIEEIRYLGEKSWATHVALSKPGLYTLIAETRPRYSEERQLFEQDLVKTMLPVFRVQDGWYAPIGLNFEIVPLTRPFGLMAPAYFSGKVLMGNSPYANMTVKAMRLNTNKRGLPTRWHEEQLLRTNEAGEFAFVCPMEGWWCFMASTVVGTPLKGPDNLFKPLELRTLFWTYVDDAKAAAHKPQRSGKEKNGK